MSRLRTDRSTASVILEDEARAAEMPLRTLRPTKVLRPAQPLQSARNKFCSQRLSERDKQSKGEKKEKGRKGREKEKKARGPCSLGDQRSRASG